MKSFKLVLLLVLLLSGCSNDSVDHLINFNLIASEKTLPANFHEIAYERETTPLFQFLVRKIVSQSEFEKTWSLYGLEKKMPNIDFHEKDVFFIGVLESGSCPYEIKNVEINSEDNKLTVALSEPEGACTSDATPRTFVIQVEKGITNNMDNIVIVQSSVETKVPLKN